MGQIRFLLNGRPVTLEDPGPVATLLDWLRAQGLTGTKEGCNEGDCGACTVAVTSPGRHGATRAMNACILFLPQLHGRAVTTIEGLASPDGALHPVQAAMVAHHGSQCGFCTPGIVMALYAAQAAGRRDWDDVLAGNLCRCTGYRPIIAAAEAAAGAAGPGSGAPAPEAAGGGEGWAPAKGALAIPGAYLPVDVDEFAAWYAAHPDATLIAGATDVGLWVTKALRDPRPVAFLGRIGSLQRIAAEGGGLTIGAGVTIARLRQAMADRHPDFAELLRRFGGMQVRSAATLGGNIANASPIGDTPPALIALGARLILRRGHDRREIPLEDYFLAYGKQDRRPGEFVEGVRIPDQPDRLACHKVSKRADQDITTVLGCFNIAVEDGRVAAVRIAYGGMAGVPARARAAEDALLGRPWSAATIRAAQDALEADFTPIDDLRASARYRMAVARNLLMRVWLARAGVATRLFGRGAA